MKEALQALFVLFGGLLTGVSGSIWFVVFACLLVVVMEILMDGEDWF